MEIPLVVARRMAVGLLIRAWICIVVISKMDVAALPMRTIHGQTLNWRQVSMARSSKAPSELTSRAASNGGAASEFVSSR